MVIRPNGHFRISAVESPIWITVLMYWHKQRGCVCIKMRNRLLFFYFFIYQGSSWNIQAVLRLHGSLTTWFILVLSFVHLVLNHSSTYTVFCLHGCFSKVSKNCVSRGSPLLCFLKMCPIFVGSVHNFGRSDYGMI